MRMRRRCPATTERPREYPTRSFDRRRRRARANPSVRKREVRSLVCRAGEPGEEEMIVVGRLGATTRSILVLLLTLLLQACGSNEREDCDEDSKPLQLSITDPVDGASFESGAVVSVAFAYRSRDWNFNTLEVTAGGESVCTVTPTTTYD